MQTLLNKELGASPEKQKSTYVLHTVIRRLEIIYASQENINMASLPYRVKDGSIPKELGDGKQKRGAQFRAIRDWIEEPGRAPLRALRDIELV